MAIISILIFFLILEIIRNQISASKKRKLYKPDLIKVITNSDKKLSDVLKYDVFGEKIEVDTCPSTRKGVLEAINKTIYPLIQDTNNKTNQVLYEGFKDNFLKNYESLRLTMHRTLFLDEKHLLDRHKIVSVIILAILSTSAYKQNRELYNSSPKKEEKNEIEKLRYAKYPNEFFAWKAGIAVLTNFIIHDLNLKNAPAVLSSTFSFDFSAEHVGSENKSSYVDTILMLLNYYNSYNQFNIISVLSLSQIIFFYEMKLVSYLQENTLLCPSTKDAA